jgi:glycine reductase
MKKVVVYLNQFFGQIGGEDKADYSPTIHAELIGPAMEYNKQLEGATVTHTIICGDNYMGSNEEEAVATILGYLEDVDFDIFLAGPAFQAGRYGNACGVIAKAVKAKFGAEIYSSMHVENPGVEMFKRDMIIFEGGKSAAAMRKNIKAMTNFVNKVIAGEETKGAEVEGYFPRGVRKQVWREDKLPATERVIDMLLKKLNGEKFVTELPIPKTDKVPVATPIVDLGGAKIAVLNTGGIVPIDNPDRIQSASATRWGKYDVTGMERLEGGVFKTIHAGFDPAAADADPNVIVPIDVLRQYEKEGKFNQLHNYFYTTVGTGTTQAEAARMGQEIVAELIEANVDGVIMVST